MAPQKRQADGRKLTRAENNGDANEAAASSTRTLNANLTRPLETIRASNETQLTRRQHEATLCAWATWGDTVQTIDRGMRARIKHAPKTAPTNEPTGSGRIRIKGTRCLASQPIRGRLQGELDLTRPQYASGQQYIYERASTWTGTGLRPYGNKQVRGNSPGQPRGETERRERGPRGD